jgi:DNA mismatch repair ATPase MutS
LGEIRINIARFFLNRPIVKTFLLEYILDNSPAVQSYIKRIAQVTGLPEEVVRRSKPVRNYVRSILGI